MYSSPLLRRADKIFYPLSYLNPCSEIYVPMLCCMLNNARRVLISLLSFIAIVWSDLLQNLQNSLQDIDHVATVLRHDQYIVWNE